VLIKINALGLACIFMNAFIFRISTCIDRKRVQESLREKLPRTGSLSLRETHIAIPFWFGLNVAQMQLKKDTSKLMRVNVVANRNWMNTVAWGVILMDAAVSASVIHF
jgi:hypothetical protein